MAQVDQVGVESIGFAIITDLFDTASRINLSYLRPIDPELAGKAEEPAYLIQFRRGTRE